MRSETIAVELPEPLLSFAAQEASRQGSSIEEWLLAEVAERMQLRTRSEEFFRIRRERAKPGSFQSLLDRVPASPPDPGDELE